MKSLLRAVRKSLRMAAITARFLILSYLAAFVVGPFVYSSVTGQTCSSWTERAWRDGRREELNASWSDAVQTVVDTRLIEVAALPGGNNGLTFPGGIAVTEDAGVQSILHEAAHRLQIDRDGLLEFSWNYSKDWVRGMYHGCGPHDSYRSVGYELQARQFAAENTSELWPLIADGMSGEDFVSALLRLDGDGSLQDMTGNGDPDTFIAAVLDKPVGWKFELGSEERQLGDRMAAAIESSVGWFGVLGVEEHRFQERIDYESAPGIEEHRFRSQ